MLAAIRQAWQALNAPPDVVQLHAGDYHLPVLSDGRDGYVVLLRHDTSEIDGQVIGHGQTRDEALTRAIHHLNQIAAALASGRDAL